MPTAKPPSPTRSSPRSATPPVGRGVADILADDSDGDRLLPRWSSSPWGLVLLASLPQAVLFLLDLWSCLVLRGDLDRVGLTAWSLLLAGVLGPAVV